MALNDDPLDRRLAVILAADVAAYSRLVAEDEEGAIRALRERRRILDAAIAAHGGRIANTAGDSVIAEFSSAVAAVTAALLAQEELATANAPLPPERRVVFRIGINLGEVIAQGQDLLGDGVNVAARIQQESTPGSVWLSAKVHDEVRGRIQAQLTARGERRMKNLPEPMALFEASLGAPLAVPPAPTRWRVSAPLWIALGLSAAIGGGVLWWKFGPATPVAVIATAPPALAPAARATIAVLAFVNLSGDPTQDYFSAGITEDLIAALGRFPSLHVLARSALPVPSIQTPSAPELGRQLGARYLVEGSVRRGVERVRATVRLSEASDGRVLWSGQFDEEMKDVFAVQDQIARNVAGALASNVQRVEQLRALAKPTENLDAYDAVLRARAGLERQTRAANREARQGFERAIELDPRYAAAHAGLSRAMHLMAAFGWTEFPEDALARAEEHGQQALALDPSSVEALNALSAVYTRTGRYDRARDASTRAVALNPSDAEAWHHLGDAQTWSGDFSAALLAFENALRLDPNPTAEFWLAQGFAHYQLKQHPLAIRALERGLAQFPNYVSLNILLAAAYAQANRQDEALQQAQLVRRAMPGFDPERFGTRFRDLVHQGYVVDGLARAGLR